jgi:hypothetical protein
VLALLVGTRSLNSYELCFNSIKSIRPACAGFIDRGLSQNLPVENYFYNRHYNECYGSCPMTKPEMSIFILVLNLTLAVAVRPLAWLFNSLVIMRYIVDVFSTYQFTKLDRYALTKCNTTMLLQRFNSVKIDAV